MLLGKFNEKCLKKHGIYFADKEDLKKTQTYKCNNKSTDFIPSNKLETYLFQKILDLTRHFFFIQYNFSKFLVPKPKITEFIPLKFNFL